MYVLFLFIMRGASLSSRTKMSVIDMFTRTFIL